MIWLDQVLALPAIGVEMVTDFFLDSELKKTFAPLITNLANTEGNITVTGTKNSGISFNEQKGFIYTIEPSNLLIESKYPIKQKRTPGALPFTELPDLQTYSNLLEGCFERFENISKAIFNANFDLKVKRLGFMAKVGLDPSELPPGVQSFYDYLRRPWKNGLIKSETTLLAQLVESSDYTDRCHHILNIDTTLSDAQLDFVLDWQRVYKKPFISNQADQLMEEIKESLDTACKYFQDFGELGVEND